MYKDEIKELYELKKDSKKIIMKDLINLYIKLKIGYPNLYNETNNIKYLIRFYINYDKNESLILNEINKKFGNDCYNIILEDILDELDVLYNYYYSYIDDVINIYEQLIENDLIDIIINRINRSYLKLDNYKYLLKLPVINKNLDKDKILKKIRSI